MCENRNYELFFGEGPFRADLHCQRRSSILVNLSKLAFGNVWAFPSAKGIRFSSWLVLTRFRRTFPLTFTASVHRLHLGCGSEDRLLMNLSSRLSFWR